MKVTVGVSNRHCHLTKEMFKKLFNEEELTELKPLKQPGQFASDNMVTIKGPKGEIDRVRVLGPFRSYNQVEVSRTDSYKLGVNPPIRKSGDLEGACDITIIGPAGEVTLPCGIIANRHVHITTEDAKKLGVVDDQPVKLSIGGEKSGVIDAFFKVTDEAYYEVHLDTDDANAFMLKQDDEIDLLLIV